MILEERVLLAKTDGKERNKVLSEYKVFIKSSAAKACGRFITESDEEFSVALLAFDEAIERFQGGKGSFLSLAETVIKSRVTDYLRKESSGPVPFSAVADEDEEIEVVGKLDAVSDAALEIQALSSEISRYGISFTALSKEVPRAGKTRKAVGEIIKYILADEKRLRKVKENGVLPAGDICSALSVHKKVPERHRKYILSAVVIMSGDYDHIKPYMKGIFDGTEVKK